MEITPIPKPVSHGWHYGHPGGPDCRGPVTSLANLKSLLLIFATPGPDLSHPVGYPFGQVSVSVDATLKFSWTSLTGCIANGVRKVVSSLGAQEGSRATMGAMPFQLFILITLPGQRASSLAGNLSWWNSGVMMEPECWPLWAPSTSAVIGSHCDGSPPPR